MENQGNNFNGNQNGPNNQNNNNGKFPKSPQTIILIVIAVILTFVGVTFMTNLLRGTTVKEVTYDEFWTKLEAGEIKEVTFTGSQIEFTLTDSKKSSGITYYTGYLDDTDLIPLLKEKGIEYSRQVEDTGSSIVDFLLVYVLPLLLIWVFFGFLIRKIGGGAGGMMGVGKSNAKVYVEKKTGVTFKDVAG